MVTKIPDVIAPPKKGPLEAIDEVIIIFKNLKATIQLIIFFD